MENKNNNFIPQDHIKKRTVLRVLGPMIAIAGIICTAIAFIDLLTLDFFEEPKFFGLAFLGIPLLFVGGVMSMFGYGGTIAKYQSREYAPVAKDTFNYIAQETKPGLKEIADAFNGEQAQSKRTQCKNCHFENNHHAKFCNQCGTKLLHTCSNCGVDNPPNASFCHHCGNKLN